MEVVWEVNAVRMYTYTIKDSSGSVRKSKSFNIV